MFGKVRFRRPLGMVVVRFNHHVKIATDRRNGLNGLKNVTVNVIVRVHAAVGELDGKDLSLFIMSNLRNVRGRDVNPIDFHDFSPLLAELPWRPDNAQKNTRNDRPLSPGVIVTIWQAPCPLITARHGVLVASPNCVAGYELLTQRSCAHLNVVSLLTTCSGCRRIAGTKQLTVRYGSGQGMRKIGPLSAANKGGGVAALKRRLERSPFTTLGSSKPSLKGSPPCCCCSSLISPP